MLIKPQTAAASKDTVRRRFGDKTGKGFCGPPRDAWLSSIAQQCSRGYAFGGHKALDRAGAVLGLLAAQGLLA